MTNNLFPTFAINGTKPNGTSQVTASDVHDLVATALELQKQIFISILAGASFLFMVGVVFLFLLKRNNAKPNPDKPRRNAIIRRGTYGLLYLSTALVFATALSTTETAGALQFASRATSSSSILMHAGRTIQVLQWMAFGFSTLFTMTVPILVAPGIVQTLKEIV